MIRKKSSEVQSSLWISADELQVKPQLWFYAKLADVLESIGFGNRVRALCEPYYSSKTNCRPPVDPEIYFKMLMIGFFENIKSERGIAARCADSLSVRAFLGYAITEATPNHSTLSIIRQRLPDSVYQNVFSIVLKALQANGLVRGKNIALDSSVMEANASLHSLHNRMTEESYAQYIRKLAQEAGVNPDDKAAVARFDRKRKDRKTSNKEWHNPHDPDAAIGQTKHGAADMIYKPEHIVDLDTGAIIDADVLTADRGDTHLLSERIAHAQVRLNDIADNPVAVEPIETVTADKGYYQVQELVAVQSSGITTVIPDKDFNRNIGALSDEEAWAVETAKSAATSRAGKALLKRRGMYVERSFAHVLDCGGERETTLRGVDNNRKRYVIATACFNLSLLMRTLFGWGTPKQRIDRLNPIGNSAYHRYLRCKKMTGNLFRRLTLHLTKNNALILRNYNRNLTR